MISSKYLRRFLPEGTKLTKRLAAKLTKAMGVKWAKKISLDAR